MCDMELLDADALQGCAGCSSRALLALLVAVGYCPRRSDALITELDGMDLVAERDYAELVQSFGLDQGNRARAVISLILERAGLCANASFADLHRLTRRKFVYAATNLRTGCAEYFDHARTPDVRVVDAIFASMCILILFLPWAHGDATYVDGCLTDAYLVGQFLPSETLHFWTREVDQPIHDWTGFLTALMTCGMRQFTRNALAGGPAPAGDARGATSDLEGRVLLFDMDGAPVPATPTTVLYELAPWGYRAACKMACPGLSLVIETMLFVQLMWIVKPLRAREGTPSCSAGDSASGTLPVEAPPPLLP